ncbi:hypothetical protein B0O99DRAFT_505576 [Bisporella sp. PMI_857]|nr:hypothetical protein B0O99DRAFT_505576 [Bisporella sp. PMI_857]
MDHGLDTHPTLNKPSNLLRLLSNTLVLYHTAPYIPIPSLLALGATSKSFKSLIYNTPNVFRHLDLSGISSLQLTSQVGAIDHGGQVWRNAQLDENVTEDDFYGGPLRGIFQNLNRREILSSVKTLILDGLTVPADLVTEIITDESFNVRILSLREVKHLNVRKLQQALMYVARPSRPANTPKLQGLYIFGPKDPVQKHSTRKSTSPLTGAIISSAGAQLGVAYGDQAAEDDNSWYEESGQIFPMFHGYEWAQTLQACEGIISFDLVLCNGPRHGRTLISDSKAWYANPGKYIPPLTASHALGPCHGCGGAPEGVASVKHISSDRLPLIAPQPLLSSAIKYAKLPNRPGPASNCKVVMRCSECLRNRYCQSCHKWWCEDCWNAPEKSATVAEQWENIGRSGNTVKLGVIRDCFECGFNCAGCIKRTQLMCKLCGGGYCLKHNEGSTLTTAGRHAINGCRC